MISRFFLRAWAAVCGLASDRDLPAPAPAPVIYPSSKMGAGFADFAVISRFSTVINGPPLCACVFAPQFVIDRRQQVNNELVIAESV